MIPNSIFQFNHRFYGFSKSYLVMLVVLCFFIAPQASAQIVSDSIYSVVDRPPAFRGKPSDMHRFIRQNMVFPDDAWMNGVEGVVQVSFVVTKDGMLMNASIENSVHPLLDIEALRIVDLMTTWRPAMRGGQAVHARVSVPVEFRLTPEERDFVSTLQKFDLHKNPPLYVIDNKIVQSRVHLPSYNVRSIRVLKGEKALEKYGDAAKNGAVVISTKRGTPPVR